MAALFTLILYPNILQLHQLKTHIVLGVLYSFMHAHMCMCVCVQVGIQVYV